MYVDKTLVYVYSICMSVRVFVCAEIERMKRISDKNLRAYNARDKMQEKEEKDKVDQ